MDHPTANTQLFSSTCLVLIAVRSQNMCRTCFVLCGVFSVKALTHTSTWA